MPSFKTYYYLVFIAIHMYMMKPFLIWISNEKKVQVINIAILNISSRTAAGPRPPQQVAAAAATGRRRRPGGAPPWRRPRRGPGGRSARRSVRRRSRPSRPRPRRRGPRPGPRMVNERANQWEILKANQVVVLDFWCILEVSLWHPPVPEDWQGLMRLPKSRNVVEETLEWCTRTR